MQLDLGNFCLFASFFMTIFGAAYGYRAAYQKDLVGTERAANAVIGSTVFGVFSFVLLAKAFLVHDFKYQYVWQHSSSDMPPIYLFSAIWGGMDGSLLLWAVMMCLVSSFAIKSAGDVPDRLYRWVVPTLSLASSFFLLVTAFLTNPFRLVPVALPPTEGNGLNPVLQDPSMFIHPPILYIGFTGAVVPFAYAVSALLSGDTSDAWTRIVRKWTLVAWGFLTVGIILGGNWAYRELGWGGFWAWDPVENSSFMPWLIGTAFLHSVFVQQHRGMLKVWNIILGISFYSLCVFGTFLTRSGIVQSVHAFAETDVGWVFLAYLGAIIFCCLVLLVFRFKSLAPERDITSWYSREAFFLLNNLVLVGITFAVLWGVMFPVISEALYGEKQVVGPPFFNRITVPMFLLLLALMVVGPLLSWKNTPLKRLYLASKGSAIVGFLVFLLALAIRPDKFLAALAFGLSYMLVGTLMSDFRRAVKADSGATFHESTKRLFVRNPQRWGGFVAHIGAALMTVAITASMAFKIEKDVVMGVGESAQIGAFEISLTDLKEGKESTYQYVSANVELRDVETGKLIKTMAPERRFYFISQETTTEVDIESTALQDVYVAFASLSQPTAGSSPTATFKLFVNPLQMWLWVGAAITVFGTVLAFAPWEVRLFERKGAEVWTTS